MVTGLYFSKRGLRAIAIGTLCNRATEASFYTAMITGADTNPPPQRAQGLYIACGGGVADD